MKCVEAVIFDLDNTLYDETQYFLDTFSKFDVTRRHLNSIKRLFDDGLRYTSSDIFKDVLDYFEAYSQKLHEELFFEYKICDSNIKLDRETLKTFSLLRSKEIRIGVLTNGVVDAQKNKVKILGLSSLVDVIVYAREVGREKPHIEAFQFVCDKLKTNPEKCIFVGDDIVNDIQGAENAGLKAVITYKYMFNMKEFKAKNILFNQVNELII
jgi:putative hydrolase of the HAD superfamily